MAEFDSKLSWVVCGAAFISHLMTVGFSYAISVYYVEFLHVFNESKGTTAWVSSLNYGMLCGIGPVASLLIHRWGHRVTMFLGGIIAAAGLLICAFATNFSVVLVSFGFLTGLGSGLAYATAIVVVSVYFKKYRPLAYGLSLAGGGVGNMAFPWISSALISSFGWRGALMISSGLVLHICVSAMLIIPEKEPNLRQLLRKNPGTNILNPKKNFTSHIVFPTNKNPKLNCDINFHNGPSKTDLHVYVVPVPLSMKSENALGAQNDSGYQAKQIKPSGVCNFPHKNLSGITSSQDNTKVLQKHKTSKKKSIKEQNRQLFNDIHFIILLVATLLFLFGVAIVYTHILAYFEAEEVSPSMGRLILSLLGGATLAGRIVLSALSQIPCVNTIILYIGAICMCGVSTILLAVWTSTANLVTCSCVFGFFVASFGPTVTECTFLITGPELFNFAHGYLMVSMGIGWLLGAPAAGMLFDATQHYPNSFYLGGGVMIAAAVVMVPVAMLLKKKDFAGNKQDSNKDCSNEE